MNTASMPFVANPAASPALPAAERFQHHHSAHCESGVMSNLLRHHGLPISESMAFGLSSALSFAYLPFIKIGGLPLVAYRMPPRSIIKGLFKPLASRFKFETFGRPESGQRRLDELLARGEVVGLQTSVYWLPYFPPDMRFHFNAHNLLVYGKEGDEYLISDPVFEEPVRCPSADLARARFARGMLAPKGLLYYPERIGADSVTAPAIRAAIKKTCRIMLGPVPIAGVRGMRLLAGKVARLPAADPTSTAFVGHLVRMQEEIGTGGAGFRFLYAAFLQEAADITGDKRLADLADQLNTIGDGWRKFALVSARMVKGREALDPPRVAQLLRGQADHEQAFFGALKSCV
jgi:hypothetical protein